MEPFTGPTSLHPNQISLLFQLLFQYNASSDALCPGLSSGGRQVLSGGTRYFFSYVVCLFADHSAIGFGWEDCGQPTPVGR